MFRLCSSDSSVSCMRALRAVWPEPSPAVLRPTCRRRHPRGLPVLMDEVSRRVLGLRLHRTEPRLALSSRFTLPSAHYNCIGVLMASFRSSIAQPAYPPGLRFAVHLTVPNAKLEAEWIATPFSWGFFHPCFIPV